MVAPQVPTGDAVRQAVLDHHAHGDGDDAMRVVTVGQGQVGHVGVKVMIAVRAAVLGVGEVQLAWPTAERVAQVVQLSGRGPQTIGAVPAPRAPAAREVP